MLLRLAAWSPHDFDTDPCPPGVPDALFPSAERLCDYKAGVGSLDSRHLLKLCAGSELRDCGDDFDDPCYATGDGVATPDDGDWSPVTGYPAISTAGADDHFGNTTTAAVVRDDSDAHFKALHAFRSAAAGSRVRASFDYYSCPGGWGANWSGSDNAVNFDLALCGSYDGGADECVYFSESLHDTDEGFDIVLPGDPGRVRLLFVDSFDQPEMAAGAGKFGARSGHMAISVA
jgi:hypothetical protein